MFFISFLLSLRGCLPIKVNTISWGLEINHFHFLNLIEKYDIFFLISKLSDIFNLHSLFAPLKPILPNIALTFFFHSHPRYLKEVKNLPHLLYSLNSPHSGFLSYQFPWNYCSHCQNSMGEGQFSAFKTADSSSYPFACEHRSVLICVLPLLELHPTCFSAP